MNNSKTKKVLIINLTRMGDLIQTIGLINAIKTSEDRPQTSEDRPQTSEDRPQTSEHHPISAGGADMPPTNPELRPPNPDNRTPNPEPRPPTTQHPTTPPEIDLLVMKAFAPIVQHFNHINEVIAFDGEILGDAIPENMWEASAELHKTLTYLNQKDYDILYNPIVSKQSSLLAYLIKAKQKLGMQFTAQREQKLTSDFIAYLLANQHNLGDHSFNLVDITAGMAGNAVRGSRFGIRETPNVFVNTIEGANYHSPAKTETSHIPAGISVAPKIPNTEHRTPNTEPQTPNTEHQTPNTDFTINVFPEDKQAISHFTSKTKATNKKVVGFHIGASQSNKAWNIQYYYQTITQLLATREYCIVLFGGYKEQEFKSHFADITSDLFFNTIGDFELNALIAAIDSIDLLVTNDTGPMHIASARQIPVIDISLGPVSKWETGPYNEKAIIVQANLDCHPCSFEHKCQHWNCQHSITPEIVIELIKSVFGVRGSGFGDFSSVKVFQTQRDIFGYMSFRPLHPHPYPLTPDEYIFTIKRFIWSLYFINSLDDYKTYYEKLIAELRKDYILPTPQSSSTILVNCQLSIHNTQNLIAELKKITNSEKTLDNFTPILLNVKRIKEKLFSDAQALQVVYDWFWFVTFKESEIEDFDIKIVAQKTIEIYEKLLKKLSILKENL